MMLYFDTSYMVRLYTTDFGWEKVTALAKSGQITCCLHGQAETVAAFHRKYRDQAISRQAMETLISEFERDSAAGAYRWLPLSSAVVTRLIKVYGKLPGTVTLRASDALHLACAAEAGLPKVYSNDTCLLAAAPHFSITGENIF